MSNRFKPKPTAVTLFSIALVLIIILFVLFLAPIPRSVRVNRAGASGQITTVRSFIPTPGTCTTVRWNVEGIQGIWVDGQGTVGASEQRTCFYPDTPLVFTIAFTDNTEQDYRAPVTILVNAPGVWLTGLIAFVALIGAGVTQFAPQGRSRQVMNQAVGSAGTVIVSLVVTLLLIEGATRLFINLTGSERDKLIYLGSPEQIAAANRSTMAIPFINYGGVPGTNGMTARGFRGDPVVLETPKPDGLFRIVALGGSTTYGHEVEADGAYPALLEDVLRDEYGYTNVEVLNGGFPNYTTLNSLVNLQTRVLDAEPDLVILYQSFNDLAKRWQQPDCFVGENPLYGFGGDPGIWTEDVANLSPSAALRLMQIRFGLIPDPSALESRFALSDLCDRTLVVRDHRDRLTANPSTFFQRNLENMAIIAQENNVPLLFTTQPYNREMVAGADDSDMGLLASVGIGQDEQNAIIAQVADERDVLFYDFARYVADNDSPDYWMDVIHMTPEGLQMQADQFAAFIDENGLISNVEE